jgi:hypothetical protein
VSIFSRLFRSNEPAEYHEHEQAVIVHFTYGSTNFQHLFALEDQLRRAVLDAGIGEYDDKDLAADGSDGFFYFYGPDAEALYQVINPLLATTTFAHIEKVTLRFGPLKRRTPKRIIQF